MIQAGTSRDTFLGDLAVVINLDGVLFTNTEFVDFTLVNRINEPPYGQFRITDLNSEFMKTSSAAYGNMLFTNTSDGSEKKASSIDFHVKQMVNEKVEGGNSLHFISWKAGVTQHNKKITAAYKGNSAKVMEEIFAKAQAPNDIKFPGSQLEYPNDTMTWITAQANMWEQLDAVVSKSYRQNDYVFWAWDDVNNTFKISSFQVEKKLADKYIILESDNAVGSTKSVKDIATDDSFTIWYYDNVQTMNRLGLDYKKIFPNVAFSGIVDGDMPSTGFRQKAFVEFLEKDVQDDKIKEIVTFEQSDEISYGDLVLKRHWPNNTHKMYSFADTYRDYKLATHAKRIEVQIYNNLGPPLGSKVSFLKTADAQKSGASGYDKLFSDKYILIEKILSYNVKTLDISSGKESMSSSNFITTLTLVSDNFTTDTTQAEENTNAVAGKLI